MKEIRYTIQDKDGIHARPAGLLVKQAKECDGKITISHMGKTADLKKLFAVMQLGIKHGDEISIVIESADEQHVADTLLNFLQNNL